MLICFNKNIKIQEQTDLLHLLQFTRKAVLESQVTPQSQRLPSAGHAGHAWPVYAPAHGMMCIQGPRLCQRGEGARKALRERVMSLNGVS